MFQSLHFIISSVYSAQEILCLANAILCAYGEVSLVSPVRFQHVCLFHPCARIASWRFLSKSLFKLPFPGS